VGERWPRRHDDDEVRRKRSRIQWIRAREKPRSWRDG
jgi:hypothetical protein